MKPEVHESQARRSGRGIRLASVGPQPRTGFIRLVPGPRNAERLLDGFMRIVAVELFQDRARIHWNLSPLPSYEAMLAGDLATLDGYTEGQTERDREHQRSSARLTQLYGLVRFTASDDLGTKYRYSR